MQNSPVVRLPEEKRHSDLGLIIAVLAIVAIVVFVVVALVNPTVVTTEPATTNYTNPELSSASYYQQLIAEDRFLRENPEIRRFIQAQEER